MPRSQIIYGEIVYWTTIVAALVCMVGPTIAIATVDNNIINPHYLFAAIFDGKSAHTIWQELAGEFPGGHFYLSKFFTGDGFTQFGLALGCGVAIPGLLGAAVAFMQDRVYGYVALALWVAFLIGFSLLGIVKGH